MMRNSTASLLAQCWRTCEIKLGFLVTPREEQRMEASCVKTAPVFPLVTLARTRALADEHTLGPLIPLHAKTVFIILIF